KRPQDQQRVPARKTQAHLSLLQLRVGVASAVLLFQRLHLGAGRLVGLLEQRGVQAGEAGRRRKRGESCRISGQFPELRLQRLGQLEPVPAPADQRVGRGGGPLGALL